MRSRWYSLILLWSNVDSPVSYQPREPERNMARRLLVASWNVSSCHARSGHESGAQMEAF